MQAMERRDFLRKMLAVGGAVAVSAFAGTALFSGQDSSKANGEKKKMKILVLTGSPRKNGNSNTLAEHFIKGAKEAGHTVVRFDAASKNVHPCIACNRCGMDGDCVFQDDFNFVREHIINADMVVLATPMYYFGISAQLKAVIDRFYAINGQIHMPKKAALLMTYANTSSKDAQPIINHYEVLLDYLGWSNSGMVIAPGVWPEGSVKNTEYPQQAYELGKKA